MLRFDFILGLNFIFLSFKSVLIIHYLTQKQRAITFTTKIKLNHNISIIIFTSPNETFLSLLQPKLSQRTTLYFYKMAA